MFLVLRHWELEKAFKSVFGWKLHNIINLTSFVGGRMERNKEIHLFNIYIKNLPEPLWCVVVNLIAEKVMKQSKWPSNLSLEA